MIHWTGIALLALAALQSPAGPPPAAQDDPWIGRPRAEVVALLGEPDRVRSGKGGGQFLTYKFHRLRAGAEAGADLVLLDVPGLGKVARVSRSDDPFAGQALTVEPVALDGRGRLTEGGLTTSEASSVSWDPKQGPPPNPAGARPTPVAGKVKLILELDAAGRVRAWSKTPPKSDD